MAMLIGIIAQFFGLSGASALFAMVAFVFYPVELLPHRAALLPKLLIWLREEGYDVKTRKKEAPHTL